MSKDRRNLRKDLVLVSVSGNRWNPRFSSHSLPRVPVLLQQTYELDFSCPSRSDTNPFVIISIKHISNLFIVSFTVLIHRTYLSVVEEYTRHDPRTVQFSGATRRRRERVGSDPWSNATRRDTQQGWPLGASRTRPESVSRWTADGPPGFPRRIFGSDPVIDGNKGEVYETLAISTKELFAINEIFNLNINK